MRQLLFAAALFGSSAIVSKAQDLEHLASPSTSAESILTAIPEYPNHIYVDARANFDDDIFVDNDGDGSRERPIRDLQVAVNNASPDTTIHVTGDTRGNPYLSYTPTESNYVFTELFIMNKRNLTILGPDPERASIGRPPLEEQNVPRFDNPYAYHPFLGGGTHFGISDSQNIVITGFTIGSDSVGILISDSSDIMICRNVFIDNQTDIESWYSYDLRVVNNTFSGWSNHRSAHKAEDPDGMYTRQAMSFHFGDLPVEQRRAYIINNIIFYCPDPPIRFQEEDVPRWGEPLIRTGLDGMYIAFNDIQDVVVPWRVEYNSPYPFQRLIGSLSNWHNLSARPAFMNPAQNDFRLATEPFVSPCIDAGTSDGVHPDGHTDIGAYECVDLQH